MSPQLAAGQRLAALSARSVSGQFVVNDARTRSTAPLLVRVSTNVNFLRLEPSLAAVSCERIRQALGRELDWGETWQGKVYLVVINAQTTNDNVLIASERFKDGWQYRVAFPDVLSRVRYVTALTQVLLLEAANRTATERSAELPTWLVQGLARQVLASSEAEVILTPPTYSAKTGPVPAAFVVERKENPLKEAHRELCSRSPISFQELSWPAEDMLSGTNTEWYACSAQLLVRELLQVDGGRAAMRQFLSNLPEFYNWQLAFLKAYRRVFQRPLDVEKWWAVQLSHFTGRQLAAETWLPDESWRKLEEVIRPLAQVHSRTNQSPHYTQVTLQTIVRDWEAAPQRQALMEKVSQLQMLRLRVSPEVLLVLDDYTITIKAFLDEREKTGVPLPGRRQAAYRRIVDDTVRQLDALDARRKGPPVTVSSNRGSD